MLRVKRKYIEEMPLTYIDDLIKKHNIVQSRYTKLRKMYENNNEIKNRQVTVGNFNNKLSHGYANYIVSTITGYFMGKQVEYKIPEAYDNQIKDILVYNDEHDVNTELATSCSIYGEAAEILFMDNDGYIRFRNVDVSELIVICDPLLMEDINTVIRHWSYTDMINDRETLVNYVEVYDREKIRRFEYYEYNSVLTARNTEEVEYHSFNDVPFVIYDNNASRLGDFETVIDLIDAYDKAQSDTANDFESFTDCYIEIVGADIDPEVAAKLKELKVFNFPNGGSVKFVTKDINDAATENYKNRLNADIHKFASVIDITDENFSGIASGEALKYKLLAMEYKCSVKESKFRKGLLRRLELITNILKVVNNEDINIIKDVTIIFNRNIVDSITNTVDIVTRLKGIVSDEGLLEMLSSLIDVEQELERRENEKDEYIDYNDLVPEIPKPNPVEEELPQIDNGEINE